MIIKWISVSIVFIAFCLFTLTLGQFSPIEITSTGLSFIFYSIVIIGLPIVVIKELGKLFAITKSIALVSHNSIKKPLGFMSQWLFYVDINSLLES